MSMTTTTDAHGAAVAGRSERLDFRRPLAGAARGRRVLVSTFVTMDGYMVGPDEDVSWVIRGFDPEMQDDIARTMHSDSDVFLFGRVTYEIFAAYWPTAIPYDDGDEISPADGKEDPRIIRALDELPKVVISSTIGAPAWRNTRVIRDGLTDEVANLRAESGKAINVQGSASVVQALVRADLVDEYHLYLHPVLLGNGKRLFADGVTRQDLELVDVKRYANGVLRLVHRRAEGSA
jgi:dihydrofolate reductase